MASPLPSPELLRKLLRYEPETGKMFWRERTPDMFSSSTYAPERVCHWWNVRYFGKEAFTSTRLGYKHGAINDTLHQAHRVIWAIHTGAWPNDDIDHINHVRCDNRICNLRPVTQAQNAMNTSIRADNTSGVTGVSKDRRNGRWGASIRANGRDVYLGKFGCKTAAAVARAAAENKYGYHENHGRL